MCVSPLSLDSSVFFNDCHGEFSDMSSLWVLDGVLMLMFLCALDDRCKRPWISDVRTVINRPCILSN